MAKRKTKRKKTGTRSGKRIRGPKGSGQDSAMLLLGSFLGFIGISWIAQKVPFLSGKIAGVVETLVGAVMVWKIGNPFVKGLGVGLAITGGNVAARGFGLLRGISMPSYLQTQKPLPSTMNGFYQVPKIGQPYPKPRGIGKTDGAKLYAGVYN